jgi:hypothetical protein
VLFDANLFYPSMIFAGRGRTLPLQWRFIERFIRDMTVLPLATLGNTTQKGWVYLCHVTQGCQTLLCLCAFKLFYISNKCCNSVSWCVNCYKPLLPWYAGKSWTLPFESRFIKRFIRDITVLALATLDNATQVGLGLFSIIS